VRRLTQATWIASPAPPARKAASNNPGGAGGAGKGTLGRLGADGADAGLRRPGTTASSSARAATQSCTPEAHSAVASLPRSSNTKPAASSTPATAPRVFTP
jgi:hypothetical protein